MGTAIIMIKMIVHKIDPRSRAKNAMQKLQHPTFSSLTFLTWDKKVWGTSGTERLKDDKVN